MTNGKRKHFQERETVWIRWRMMRTTGGMTWFPIQDAFGFGALVYTEIPGLYHRALV